MKFVIDRGVWRCGGLLSDRVKGLGETQLLNDVGFRCCLGIVSAQLGVPDTALWDISQPDCVESDHHTKLVGTLLDDNGEHTGLADEAIDINDNNELTQEQREAALVEAFESRGHQLEFTGEFAA